MPPPDLDRDDLINSGVLGLIRAIQTYDASRNPNFKAYAALKIKFAIFEELRNRSFISSWYKDRGVTLVSSDDERAEKSAVKEDQATPHTELQRTEISEVLEYALSKLPEMQRNILIMAYYQGLYFQEIADHFKLSHARICMVKDQALTRLRSPRHLKLRAFFEAGNTQP